MTRWRWCAVAGLIAFTASFLFGKIPGLVACGPTGGLSPIIGFEMARTPAAVAAMFGAEPCHSTLVAAQKLGLILDCFWFIPAYTAFLVLAALASDARSTVRTLLVAGLMIAGLSDEVEGVILYAILRDLPGTQALSDALFWAVHIKFGLLALGSLGIAVQLVVRRRLVALGAGIVAGIGGLRACYGFLTHTATMMAGLTLAWVTLLLAAIIFSFWPSLFSERVTPPRAPATPSA